MAGWEGGGGGGAYRVCPANHTPDRGRGRGETKRKQIKWKTQS